MEGDQSSHAAGRLILLLTLATTAAVGAAVPASVAYRANAAVQGKVDSWLILFPKIDARTAVDSITQLLLALRNPAHVRYALHQMKVKQFVVLFAVPMIGGAYFLGNHVVSNIIGAISTLEGILFAWALRFTLAATLFLTGGWLLMKQSAKPSGFPRHIVGLLEDGKGTSGDNECFHQDISLDELRLLNFLELITVGMQSEAHPWGAPPKSRTTGVWGMTGGTKRGKPQLGFTSTRYHLAFVGYAAAIACAKNPAYVGRVKRILEAVIAHMLEEEVWKSVTDHYWPDLGNPFLCEENIMWTGHVLQLCALYEAQTGCHRYSQPGGLVARRFGSETGNPMTVYESSVPELANRIAQSMRDNPTGGVPCEPGLVFFQCNCHPQVAMRILEQLPAIDGEEKTFVKERTRWERSSLHTMCAATGQGFGTGAFRILWKADQHAKQGSAAAPLGHLGSDGWNLTHYYAWAVSEKIPRRIWFDVCRPILDTFTGVFENDPVRKNPPCETQMDKTRNLLQPDEMASASPNGCCFNLNIPVSAWACSILPVVAQAQDDKKYDEIYAWLRKHYLVSSSIADDGNAVDYLEESVEWMVGNTAQYLMGVALKSDPGLYRRMVQKPLQLQQEFSAIVLDNAEWVEDIATKSVCSKAGVFRCHYDEESHSLHVGVYRTSIGKASLRLHFESSAKPMFPTKVVVSDEDHAFKYDKTNNDVTVIGAAGHSPTNILELKVYFV